MEASESDLAIIIVKSIFMCVFIALGIIGNCTVIVSIKKISKTTDDTELFRFQSRHRRSSVLDNRNADDFSNDNMREVGAR